MRLVFLAVTMVVGNLAWAAASESAIEVTGIGTVTFVPDIASITISITARDRDAKVAQSTANSAVAAALKVIDDLGIESRDVTATVMRMHPVYRRARSPGDLQTIEAFESQRSITVRVRELERLGDVVNGALDGGINGIQQIQLDTSERAALDRGTAGRVSRARGCG